MENKVWSIIARLHSRHVFSSTSIHSSDNNRNNNIHMILYYFTIWILDDIVEIQRYAWLRMVKRSHSYSKIFQPILNMNKKKSVLILKRLLAILIHSDSVAYCSTRSLTQSHTQSHTQTRILNVLIWFHSFDVKLFFISHLVGFSCERCANICEFSWTAKR